MKESKSKQEEIVNHLFVLGRMQRDGAPVSDAIEKDWNEYGKEARKALEEKLAKQRAHFDELFKHEKGDRR